MTLHQRMKDALEAWTAVLNDNSRADLVDDILGIELQIRNTMAKELASPQADPHQPKHD